MTHREFYENIVNGTVNTDIVSFAEECIKKLDERNEKRKSSGSKTAKENEPIKANILDLLNRKGTSLLAKEIGAELGITPNKATALCGQLVKSGELTSTKVKDGKSKVNSYGVS